MILSSSLCMLLIMAVPSWLSAKTGSQASALANELLIYAAAFSAYNHENGVWPPESAGGVVPRGMEGRLPRFEMKSSVGGSWHWERDRADTKACISLVGHRASRSVIERADNLLDDGNTATGALIAKGNRLMLLLEK